MYTAVCSVIRDVCLCVCPLHFTVVNMAKQLTEVLLNMPTNPSFLVLSEINHFLRKSAAFLQCKLQSVVLVLKEICYLPAGFDDI